MLGSKQLDVKKEGWKGRLGALLKVLTLKWWGTADINAYTCVIGVQCIFCHSGHTSNVCASGGTLNKS